MTVKDPYKRRIERALGSDNSIINVNDVLEKYKDNLDDYLVLLYSKRFLGIDFNNENELDFDQAFSLLKEKYNIDFDISNSLKNEDYSTLSRVLIETIDQLKFKESGLKKLSNELKWSVFDELSKDNIELVNKKEQLFEKYKGSEDSLFAAIQIKYPNNRDLLSNPYRKDLIDLFSKYRPEKINTVDQILHEWKGRETYLLSNLKVKFEKQSEAESIKINKKLITQKALKVKTEQEQIPKKEIAQSSDLDKEKQTTKKEELERIKKANEAQKAKEKEALKLANERAEREKVNAAQIAKEKERDEFKAAQELKEKKVLEQKEVKEAKEKVPLNKVFEKKESNSSLDTYNLLPKRNWKGLAVPIIKARNKAAASEIAHSYSEYLPDYQGRKIYQFGEKVLFLTNSINKETKKKKPIFLYGSVAILLLIGLSLGVLYFIDENIPVGNDQIISVEKTSKSESLNTVDVASNEQKTENLHKRIENKKETINKTVSFESNSYAYSVEKQENDKDINVTDTINNNSNKNADENTTEESKELNHQIEETENSVAAFSEDQEIIVTDQKEIETTEISKSFSNSQMSYHLIAGSFTDESNAKNYCKDLQKNGFNPVYLGEIQGWYKVAYQSFNTSREANNKLVELRSDGRTAWVQYFKQ